MSLFVLGVFLLWPPAAEPGEKTPPAELEPRELVVTLSPGESETVQATASFKSSVPATTAEVVPALAPYVSVSPMAIPAMVAGSSQVIDLSFSVPQGTHFQTIEGTLHLRAGTKTIAQPLPITLNVWASASSSTVSLQYPPSLQLNESLQALGGPISLSTFGAIRVEGGTMAVGDLQIDVTKIPLPSRPLDDVIAHELSDANIESRTSQTISGVQSIRVTVTDQYTPTYGEKTIAVYAPHNEFLYKFFLSYRLTDPGEPQFIATFDQILSTVKLE